MTGPRPHGPLPERRHRLAATAAGSTSPTEGARPARTRAARGRDATGSPERPYARHAGNQYALAARARRADGAAGAGAPTCSRGSPRQALDNRFAAARAATARIFAAPARPGEARHLRRRREPHLRPGARRSRPARTATRGSCTGGEAITPNQHALASAFVTLDRFFAAGGVSGDGWQWTDGGAHDRRRREGDPRGVRGPRAAHLRLGGQEPRDQRGARRARSRSAWPLEPVRSPGPLPGAVDGPRRSSAAVGRGARGGAVGARLRRLLRSTSRYGLPASDPAQRAARPHALRDRRRGSRSRRAARSRA